MTNPEQRRLKVPALIYGTAWKEELTEGLVRQALQAGFRGIDTANQRKHYREADVGRALVAEIGRGTVTREELFLQTKFTYQAAQDHRLPYDPSAPIALQVAQSFQSSLSHLGVDKIDSYVLHGPSFPTGLSKADLESWTAMEALHEEGKLRYLGISNVRPDQLAALLRLSRVRPTFVQNRCYASFGWDAEVRAICNLEGLVYQGFSLLTANPQILRGGLVEGMARTYRRTPAQIIFRFAIQIGIIPLTGTTDPRHMSEDLGVHEFELTAPEVKAIEGAGS